MGKSLIDHGADWLDNLLNVTNARPCQFGLRGVIVAISIWQV